MRVRQMGREKMNDMNIPMPNLKPAEWTNILRMLEDPAKIGLLGRFDLIGVCSFVTLLEYEYFTPDTVMNQLYELAVLQQAGVPWFLVIIPKAYLEAADDVAKRVGLCRVQGEPEEFSSCPDDERFPPTMDNVWTLLNVTNHFADDCDPQIREAAYRAEDDTIQRTAEDHYRRMMGETSSD